MDMLFYDGKCPLCLREIRILERLKDDHLRLVDVHGYTPAPGDPSLEAMLLRLHLKSEDGTWVSGVDATVRAWSHTRWGALFKPMRWSLFSGLADRAYNYWARRRFEGLYCEERCFVPARASQPRPAGQPDKQ